MKENIDDVVRMLDGMVLREDAMWEALLQAENYLI